MDERTHRAGERAGESGWRISPGIEFGSVEGSGARRSAAGTDPVCGAIRPSDRNMGDSVSGVNTFLGESGQRYVARGGVRQRWWFRVG
jgi:hypothetical protein